MNPNNNVPNMELPPPIETSSEPTDNQLIGPETAPIKEVEPIPNDNPFAASSNVIPSDNNPVVSQINDPILPVNSDQGQVQSAEIDNDKIEMDWVSKVKKVVNENKEDPYKQSEAMSQLKAEYLEKEHNKIIKLK